MRESDLRIDDMRVVPQDLTESEIAKLAVLNDEPESISDYQHAHLEAVNAALARGIASIPSEDLVPSVLRTMQGDAGVYRLVESRLDPAHDALAFADCKCNPKQPKDVVMAPVLPGNLGQTNCRKCGERLPGVLGYGPPCGCS